ncbi:redox-regulated ATPase YchF [Xylocopilactobacillus apicola]|uniref:Ribosome-binding ATPase YchF n=1 Tax=Xylocopilactobacillus apicola TaxID=2932184 RepID=A0AAU9DGB8_9LACO|nr:redox-regulated ATPase YchF [Xylocopilactobacillus apicola]BDR58995.1 ribosome-binding ATPase YchF [Xylocopilactobacillus apicola]
MSLTAGIVGLPNVGKSTLFNAITNAGAEMANYPFATIEPNVGVVEVPDKRLDRLQEIIPAKKIIPTTFEFTDIAGIVKGASKGEGLGNKFLANIREVDAIVHIVRAFDDPNITSVTGTVDPKDDIETINLELEIADLDSVTKRLGRVEKVARAHDKEAMAELPLLQRIKKALEEGKPARSLEFNKDEAKIVKGFFLLTTKPVIYVANISDESIADPMQSPYFKVVKEIADSENSPALAISVRTEEEISELDPSDRSDFLADLGAKESGLDQLIQATYRLLGLGTFFTAGGKENRAWTYKVGTKAPQAAGIIHSDFERGFIRAETVSFSDLDQYGSMEAVKEAGRLRIEGKDYVVQDGDIFEFRFNV